MGPVILVEAADVEILGFEVILVGRCRASLDADPEQVEGVADELFPIGLFQRGAPGQRAAQMYGAIGGISGAMQPVVDPDVARVLRFQKHFFEKPLGGKIVAQRGGLAFLEGRKGRGQRPPGRLVDA